MAFPEPSGTQKTPAWQGFSTCADTSVPAVKPIIAPLDVKACWRLAWRAVLCVLLVSAPTLLLGNSVDHPLNPDVLLAVLACAALASVWRARLAMPCALLLTALLLLRLAEAGTQQALARSFNLAMDWQLAAPLHDLLRRNLGPPAYLVELGVALGLAVLTWILAQLLRRPAPRSAGWLLLPWLGVTLMWPQQAAPLLSAGATQLQRGLATWQERRRFEPTLADDPLAAIADTDLFSALRGVDVIVAFVESYGADTLDDPLHAAQVRAELDSWPQRFAAQGLAVASARFTSPVQGGQSWLPQTTLLSGRWIDSPLRYALITREGRQPGMLPRDFARAGHDSIAIRPANVMAWLEAPAYGYGKIIDAAASGYRGPAFNWVTMPDQYTWSRLQRERERERERGGRARYIDVALLSSHAPWTPILPLLDDWSQIGDGSVYAQWAGSGESPDQLWQDPARVREHYAMALHYSLAVIGAYVQRHVDAHCLLIVLGDHPAAPLVTGGPQHEVPMHVISGDPALVQRFIDAGFSAGSIPPQRKTAPPLSAFRSWFANAFSGSGERRVLLPAEQPDQVSAERADQ